jgi:hypothetical protein
VSDFDRDLYGPGIERILGTCAAWLRGIKRHQIREVTFDALIAGAEFSFHVHVNADGSVRAQAWTDGDLVFSGDETAWGAPA